MTMRRTAETILILATVVAIGIGTWQVAFASTKVARDLRVHTVDIDFGDEQDIWIAGAGVYIPYSQMRGTLIVHRPDHEENYNWRPTVFTERLLDVRVFDNDGREFDRTYGFVYVYFDLDRLEQNAWFRTDRLSIWHYD